MAKLQALVVDDDDLSRDLLCAMLARLDVAATLCGSGQQALDILAGASFDLMMLDLRLPDMEGLDVVRRREAIPGAVLPKVVLTTGAERVESREKCEQAGCAGFLSKPFTFSEFKEVMTAIYPELSAD